MSNNDIEKLIGAKLAARPTVQLAIQQVEFISQAADQLRRARAETGKSLVDISRQTHIPSERILAFEIGHPSDEISLSDIAVIAAALGKKPRLELS